MLDAVPDNAALMPFASQQNRVTRARERYRLKNGFLAIDDLEEVLPFNGAFRSGTSCYLRDDLFSGFVARILVREH